MRSEIALLHKKFGSTVIYVTHDQVEAMTLADRIAVLNRGRLEQAGPPLELYQRPRSRFVASFIGTPPMNFVSMSEANFRQAPPKAEIVGFRPECTVLSGGSEVSGMERLGTGKVNLIEPLGSMTHVHLRTGEHTVVAEIRDQLVPTLDEELGIWVNPKDFLYFDSEGVALT
jgi:ABC-type sugar transport system ATPase subunit